MFYVDGFVAAVPTANKEAYHKHAADAAPVFLEAGALSVVECRGDDVPDGKLRSFPMAVKCQPDVNPMPFDGKRLIYGGFSAIVAM